MLRYEFEEVPYIRKGKAIADLMGVAAIDIGEPDVPAHVEEITLWYSRGRGNTDEIKVCPLADEKLWNYLETQILSRAAVKVAEKRAEAFADEVDEPYDRLLPQEML